MKTMTELTNEIQAFIGRPATLLLLTRAGEASRASEQTVAPVHVLEVFAHRLEQGWTADKLARMTNGKLIKLARKVRERQHDN